MDIIWIASFPRSGNTFFRNVLFHVYGINSLENEDEINGLVDGNYAFVKTHLMPFQLKKYDRKSNECAPQEHQRRPAAIMPRSTQDRQRESTANNRPLQAKRCLLAKLTQSGRQSIQRLYWLAVRPY